MPMQNSSKPWWRELWPWLLMAGPCIAALACAVTIVLAVRGSDAQRIDDGGVKCGLLVSKPAIQAAPQPAPAQQNG